MIAVASLEGLIEVFVVCRQAEMVSWAEKRANAFVSLTPL